ncbi:MAG TPA: glycerol-3-phosphate 1-O-acyltransferase PlsY [Thermodesulfobacteriota bacterium]|nr:glycerol-3-phosphate 1-O-acyltransferase PlsY [Thermodesulfobacteriota bacterium]
MTVLLLIFAYLLGSIPTGVILARAFSNIDPRTQGSKNIGATNIYRTAGKKLGIITLLGDILKGLIPVVIARGALESHFWIGAVALAAFLGHLYPIFLKFKGGKGIATGLGAFLALAPLSAILSFLVFLAVVYKWRYISLGSLTATVTFPIFLAMLSPYYIYIPFAVIIGVFIFYRHRGNIERLLAGNESKFGAKKSSEQ